MERTNEAWLEQLAGDDPRRQAALVDLRQVLLRRLRSALASDSRVDDGFLEDAVQDALLRVMERLGQFEGRSRFLTWATTVAIRTALGELRRRRFSDVSIEELTEGWEIVEDSPGPDRGRWEILDKMHEVIREQLTEKQRKALLAELKGMPQSEIARQLGSKRNAVYKLTHDARKRLKRGLETAGFGAEHVRTAFAR
jgi:RNA polymerase sigma-70 factor (ECF subfamily)